MKQKRPLRRQYQILPNDNVVGPVNNDGGPDVEQHANLAVSDIQVVDGVHAGRYNGHIAVVPESGARVD